MGWFSSLREKFFGKKEEENRDAVCSYEEVPGPSVRYARCGHDAPYEAKVSFYERKGTFGVPSDLFDERDGLLVVQMSCPRCRFEELKKLFIRCVLCGEVIMPGEPVAVYWKRNKGMRKKIGMLVGENYLGCMAWDCCPSGGFWGGHWTENGFVSAFSDGGSVADEVMRTGRAVVGNIETGKVEVINHDDENGSGKKS